MTYDWEKAEKERIERKRYPQSWDKPMSTRLFYESLGSRAKMRRWYRAIKYEKLSPEAYPFVVRKIDKLIERIDLLLESMV